MTVHDLMDFMFANLPLVPPCVGFCVIPDTPKMKYIITE